MPGICHSSAPQCSGHRTGKPQQSWSLGVQSSHTMPGLVVARAGKKWNVRLIQGLHAKWARFILWPTNKASAVLPRLDHVSGTRASTSAKNNINATLLMSKALHPFVWSKPTARSITPLRPHRPLPVHHLKSRAPNGMLELLPTDISLTTLRQRATPHEEVSPREPFSLSQMSQANKSRTKHRKVAISWSLAGPFLGCKTHGNKSLATKALANNFTAIQLIAWALCTLNSSNDRQKNAAPNIVQFFVIVCHIINVTKLKSKTTSVEGLGQCNIAHGSQLVYSACQEWYKHGLPFINFFPSALYIHSICVAERASLLLAKVEPVKVAVKFTCAPYHGWSWLYCLHTIVCHAAFMAIHFMLFAVRV